MRITRKNIKHKRSNKIKKTTKVHKRHSINKNSKNKNKNKNKKTKRGGGTMQSFMRNPSPKYEEREIKGYVLITDAKKVAKKKDIQVGDIVVSIDNKFIAEISKINYNYDYNNIRYIYSFSLGRILHNTSKGNPETALYINYNKTWIAISPKEYKNFTT